MKINFNSPLILIYSGICVLFFLIQEYMFTSFNQYIALGPNFDFNFYSYITHVFGHADANHLVSNLTFILLLGPMLEWKYGAKRLTILIIITALITALLNKIFFSTGLIGASGIVFMFIILSSFTNREKGTIPLTFILIFILFIGKETLSIYKNDNISQFAHIIGGIIGGIAGFIIDKKKFI